MRPLFPEIKPNQSYSIEVTGGHHIYVEESGNENGIPVVYCHGGPGGGCAPFHRRFYDPEVYRIILFDQRGCGLSTPHCANDINAVWQNTSQDLVADMEVIRQHLNIENWLVTGGSWGTTLALLYAIHHPQRVTGLILRGVFLARQQDLDWLYGDQGAGQIFPENYQDFSRNQNTESTSDLLAGFYEQLTGDNDLTQLVAAKQFGSWEASIAQLKLAGKLELGSNKDVIASALITCHYFTNHSFIYESEILSEIDKIQEIPGYIVHGRYDVVCKPEGAFTLSQHWPRAVLDMVPAAGHSGLEPGITDALIRASQKMAEYLTNKEQS